MCTARPTVWSLSVPVGRRVKAAEKTFGVPPVLPNLISLGHKAHSKPDFIGSEACIRDDESMTFRRHISVGTICCTLRSMSGPAPWGCRDGSWCAECSIYSLQALVVYPPIAIRRYPYFQGPSLLTLRMFGRSTL